MLKHRILTLGLLGLLTTVLAISGFRTGGHDHDDQHADDHHVENEEIEEEEAEQEAEPAVEEVNYRYRVTIQPIVVTSDDGSEIANPDGNMLDEETQGIFDQVNIEIEILEPIKYARSPMYDGVFGSEYNVEEEIGKAPIPEDETIAVVFYVKSIHPDGSGGAMGMIGGRFMFLGNAAVAKGRVHVLAHELGHNLGLGHEDYGALEVPSTIMSGNPATAMDDVYPNGLRLNYITRQQHARILQSPLVKTIDPPSGKPDPEREEHTHE